MPVQSVSVVAAAVVAGEVLGAAGAAAGVDDEVAAVVAVWYLGAQCLHCGSGFEYAKRSSLAALCNGHIEVGGGDVVGGATSFTEYRMKDKSRSKCLGSPPKTSLGRLEWQRDKRVYSC